MRIISHDETAPGGVLINLGVWTGISAPEGHLKFVIKVILPPEQGMMGTPKYHSENIKWSGTRKGIRLALLDFLSKGPGKEKDIHEAMVYLLQTFL